MSVACLSSSILLLVPAYICGRSKCSLDPLSAPQNSVCYFGLPVNWMCLSDDLAVENEDASLSSLKKERFIHIICLTDICLNFVIKGAP